MSASVWRPVWLLVLSSVCYLVLAESEDTVEDAGLFVAATALWLVSVIATPVLLWRTQFPVLPGEHLPQVVVILVGVLVIVFAPLLFRWIDNNMFFGVLFIVIVLVSRKTVPIMAVVGSVSLGLWLQWAVAWSLHRVIGVARRVRIQDTNMV